MRRGSCCSFASAAVSSVALLSQTRRLFLRLVDPLPPEDLLAVPPGFSNNILWNLGHVVVTQQLLHYGLSGLPLHVSETLVAQCRKGTSPADWTVPPDLGEIRTLLTELPERLAEDLAAGRFARYRPYMTSVGVELTDLETALDFNLYHEGLHTGSVLALRRAMRASRTPEQASAAGVRERLRSHGSSTRAMWPTASTRWTR